MAPFTLTFAEPVVSVQLDHLTYDGERQLNILSDGSPAASQENVVAFWSSTSSTAGSKTHSDDTD